MQVNDFEGVYGVPPHNVLSRPRFTTVYDEFWRRVERFHNCQRRSSQLTDLDRKEILHSRDHPWNDVFLDQQRCRLNRRPAYLLLSQHLNKHFDFSNCLLSLSNH